MSTPTLPILKAAAPRVGLLGFALLASLAGIPCRAQEASDRAGMSDAIGGDGTRTIIVQPHGELPKPPVFFTAGAKATAQVGPRDIKQVIQATVQVIQGEAETLSFGLKGAGQVTKVEGENLRSWAIRQEGALRFLDLQVNEEVTELDVQIEIHSSALKLPADVELTHLAPGESVGFESTVTINYAAGVEGVVTAAEGFAPLDVDGAVAFQSSTGGQIRLSLSRDGAAPGPVELSDTTLQGDLHSNGKSMSFQLRSTANVNEDGAEITILSGNAAVIRVPADGNYRLRLATENRRPVYKLVFAKAGTFPVSLDFVATILVPGANWQSMDFTIAAGAVVPLTLRGLDSELEFHRDQQSIVPRRGDEQDHWLGFLPATGHARLRWKTARETGTGELFFTTTCHVDAKVGAGLLRQDHDITYQVLQGELESLTILLNGPGEILDVRGSNIVAWRVTSEGEARRLDVTLSQPISAASQLKIRSQTPLGAFPVRVEGLRLRPLGAIRHSGFLRLANLGSVRLEPIGLAGLTQLAPEQFPGEQVEARQTFVYRFPAADHAFTVAADRIQPEVNISELVLYQLAETDRVIKADIELDIREAPIREWDISIPDDYSIVSVTGANVADYIAATEAADGRRNLKVVFGQDVAGRQLVALHLEKNEAAAQEDWVLPRIEFPDAKTVRGDIGIVGAPGFRIAVGATNLLVEKPLSYFPKPTPNLQQAFRIREPDWSATMQIELLERSVQSDVFHLYSLSQQTVYGSALINYFVTGAPVSEWRVLVPEALGNVMVDGQDVRTWRREGDTLIVSLHQPVMGPYTLLVTFEEKPDTTDASFPAGRIAPIGVQGRTWLHPGGQPGAGRNRYVVGLGRTVAT